MISKVTHSLNLPAAGRTQLSSAPPASPDSRNPSDFGDLKVGFEPRKRSPAGEASEGVRRSPSPLRRAVKQVLRDEARMERLMKKALRGRIRSMEDLLALQVTVYRYAQQAEILSKVVDRATQAVKQTLQTQL